MPSTKSRVRKKSHFSRVIELERRMFPAGDATIKETNSKLMSLLLEEAGELAGSTRSYFGRKYRPEVNTGDLEAIKGELGDLLFIAMRLCDLWNTTPDECLEIVLKKLKGRLKASQAA
jgi:NTP pyrophosphatase (non-canonical NTP hydrolase)